MQYRVIVVGVSFGGLDALHTILPSLPEKFPVPVVVVQHVGAEDGVYMVESLNAASHVTVKAAEEKESIQPGTVYFAPANYHLLIEDDLTLSLAADEKVNYARPSIDVLFESAAYALGAQVVGVILTGANADGAKGLEKIHDNGGLAVVQDPATAVADAMPLGALACVAADHIVKLDEIGPFLVELVKGNE